MQYTYFSQWDFEKSAIPSCSITRMNETLLTMLDHMRYLYGYPIIVTSAYRSKQWEISHGRDGSSFHCLGVAVDISCPGSFDRLHLIQCALEAGFCRIGIGKNFLHLDIGDKLIEEREARPAIWLYD